MKHNKKRNTAFLYESLIQELTKAIMNKDKQRKANIIKIIKENFGKGSSLKEDLEIYNNLLYLPYLWALCLIAGYLDWLKYQLMYLKKAD